MVTKYMGICDASNKRYVLYKDHYAFHITTKKNIDSIKSKGLIPSLGVRSQSKDDKERAIYFFDNLYNLYEWIEVLYKNEDLSSLILLRFNLKRKHFYVHNDGEDFYLLNKIEPTKLEYLEDLDENIYRKKLIWKSLIDYKEV